MQEIREFVIGLMQLVKKMKRKMISKEMVTQTSKICFFNRIPSVIRAQLMHPSGNESGTRLQQRVTATSGNLSIDLVNRTRVKH